MIMLMRSSVEISTRARRIYRGERQWWRMKMALLLEEITCWRGEWKRCRVRTCLYRPPLWGRIRSHNNMQLNIDSYMETDKKKLHTERRCRIIDREWRREDIVWDNECLILSPSTKILREYREMGKLEERILQYQKQSARVHAHPHTPLYIPFVFQRWWVI